MTGAILAGGLFSSTQAQQFCGAYDELTKFLSERHGETVRMRAIVSGGDSILEIWASEKGTWTAIIRQNPTQACVVADGEGYSPVKSLKKKTGLRI